MHIVAAHSSDGKSYFTSENIGSLYNGLKLTIIPERTSTNAIVSLNGRTIRLSGGYTTSAHKSPLVSSWMVANKPVELIYDGTYWIVTNFYSVATANAQIVLEGNDNTTFMTPYLSKIQTNALIAAAHVNTPEIYIKESVEAMDEITSMKNGDLCIILSGETTAQSIYRYYTHDINGIDITDTWVWMTDLSLFAPQSVLELEGEAWDYSLGNSARITLAADAILSITNVYSGAYGVLDVYPYPA